MKFLKYIPKNDDAYLEEGLVNLNNIISVEKSYFHKKHRNKPPETLFVAKQHSGTHPDRIRIARYPGTTDKTVKEVMKENMVKI